MTSPELGRAEGLLVAGVVEDRRRWRLKEGGEVALAPSAVGGGGRWLGRRWRRGNQEEEDEDDGRRAEG
jgi:hypothetical protein